MEATVLTHISQNRVIAILALFLAVSFAGCAQDSSNMAVPAAVTIRGSSCIGDANPTCTVADRRLILDGITLDDGSKAVGILIESLDQDLVIANASIKMIDTGIQIQATCPYCSVTIRDSTISARNQGIVVGMAGQVEGPVALLHSTVIAESIGSTIRQGDDVFGNGTIGLLVGDVSENVTLDHVQFQSPAPNLGRAIWGIGRAQGIEAENVSINGFGRGFVGEWDHITLRDVRIECEYDALFLKGTPTLEVDGLDVHGCAHALECEAYHCPPAILVAGDGSEPGSTAAFRNMVLEGNEFSMAIVSPQRLTMSHFEIRNGSVGLLAFPRTLVMEQGTIEGNRLVGAVVHVHTLRAEGMRFVDNGGRSNDEIDNGGLYVRQQSPPVDGATKIIRNSTFSGNEPFGLVGGHEYLVDAAYNWWGSALGPSPGTPAALGNPQSPGFGDMVAGTLMITEPHLTNPP